MSDCVHYKSIWFGGAVQDDNSSGVIRCLFLYPGIKSMASLSLEANCETLEQHGRSTTSLLAVICPPNGVQFHPL